MQCEKAREHFTDYLSDSLGDNVKSDVKQHLIECETCRDEAEAAARALGVTPVARAELFAAALPV